MTTPAQTVHGLLQEAAAARGEFDGAVYPEHRLSYGELLDEANRASRLLVGLGLAPGECVGLMLPAALSQVVMLGAMRFGAVPVPLNGRLKAVELEFLVQHSEMTMLVCDQPAAAIAAGAIEGRNCRLVVIDEDLQTETATEAEEAELARLQQAVTAQDPSMILYTSGTSSKPKGVVHTHHTLVGEGRAVADRLELGPEDRFWSPLPMFHCGGIVTMLGAMAAGAAFCHVGAFDAGGRAGPAGAGTVHARVPGIRDDLAERPGPPPVSRPRTCRICAPSSTSASVSGCARCRSGCRPRSRSPRMD